MYTKRFFSFFVFFLPSPSSLPLFEELMAGALVRCTLSPVGSRPSIPSRGSRSLRGQRDLHVTSAHKSLESSIFLIFFQANLEMASNKLLVDYKTCCHDHPPYMAARLQGGLCIDASDPNVFPIVHLLRVQPSFQRPLIQAHIVIVTSSLLISPWWSSSTILEVAAFFLYTTLALLVVAIQQYLP